MFRFSSSSRATVSSRAARLMAQKIRGVREHKIHTLTLNAGSTTLKYSLYDIPDPHDSKAAPTLVASGMIDRVGSSDGATITHNQQVVVASEPISNHVDGLTRLAALLPPDLPIDCVGHRVVHGGTQFVQPTLISTSVLNDLQQLHSLAPLHNPPAVAGIEASLQLFPGAQQVAVFDTAYHVATLPPSSFRYAVPKELFHEHGVRKYGFHGTSYQYVVGEVAKHLRKPVSEVNLIVMHLGGGASACCVEQGKSIDTTMGLTPLEGLVMATRSGDVDAGIYDFLLTKGYSTEEIYRLLNKESGLLGLTGMSDMRSVKDKALEGETPSQLARDLFKERCRKYLGSYLVKLRGNLDAVVFTGGIGENDAEMRQLILEGLEDNFQIGVDKGKNKNATASNSGIMEIQPSFSKIKVLVTPTDEEVSIALQASRVVAPEPTQGEEESFPNKPLVPRPQNLSSNLFCHSLGHVYTAGEELGLLSMFSAYVDRVGYFRPIGRRGDKDYRVELMKKHFKLIDDEEEEMFGVDEDEAWSLLSEGHEDELFERILEKYLAYKAKKDFILVSGFTSEDDSLHLNAKICSSLSLPAVLIGNVEHDTQFGIARSAFKSHGSDCLGAVVSGVQDPDLERRKLADMDMEPIALLPRDNVLSKRTVNEVVRILDDSVYLYGSEYSNRSIDKIRIYTMQVDDMLPLMSENELSVVYHNRLDVLMSILLAAQSSNAPMPAGVICTLHNPGDMNPRVQSILDGLKDIRIPVIATSMDTIEATQKVQNEPVFMASESKKKIEVAQTQMETYLDYSFLENFRSDDDSVPGPSDIGPRLFQYSTFMKARELQKTVVLPEGADPRVVEAASILVKRNLCKVLLIGDPKVIRANAEKVEVSLDGITVLDPQNYDRMDELVDAFVEARKSKGLTEHDAKQYLLEDVNYFGTLMMHCGLADGMVSGAMHSSANTIRPALQVLKTSPGASIVSSIFFMLLEDGVKVFGDCAINVDPTSEQLTEIAVESAKTAQKFGISPRVALLSYATGDSNKGALITKVHDAAEGAKAKAAKEGFMDPSLIEGPLQFDAAVDPAVAAVKMKDSPVAGKANVLIFPDLNSGNNGYKAVQQASKSIAVGPILQGLKKPVNDLSRGATVDDIVNTAVLTALQSDSA